jgi:hypothetical protein
MPPLRSGVHQVGNNETNNDAEQSSDKPTHLIPFLCRKPRTPEMTVVGKRLLPHHSMEVLAGRVVFHDQLNFTGHGNLGTLGAPHQNRLQFVQLHLEV